MSWLAWPRHRIEAPFALAGRRIVRVNEPAHSVLAARHADDDQSLHRQRRDREAVSRAIIRRDHVPHHGPGLGVERDHVRIQRAHKNLVAQNCEPAIHPPAARTNISRNLPLVHPDGPPRAGIERKCAVILPRRIQNTVDNQGRGLHLPGRSGLVHPLRDHGSGIGDVDLIEGTEALSGVVPGISHPVLWFLRRIHQPFESHLREGVTRKEGH